MHSRIFIVAIATAIVLPAAAHAQSDASRVTREQVRQELVQLERAGYRPGRANDPHYPDDLLAAEARIRTAASTDPYAVGAVGGVTNDRSASGSRVGVNGAQNALFAHH
ncbi:DUF4148 domain-containing protein [Paraburkholderia pallida]|uniref:DUF4148 domain-containing protein n=1 Tax=Paraburkholderia pallida TaxID=2547399 RepID=A0A4P7D1T7_9BURK|nr:DUF4148 domain-containing protein [Paraburkholderia pallida]QBR02576.1 DUF4148 domain-containing protein [Paraburkholderia pallida]